MKNFTKQYPVSKTLRFELKPVGKTLEHIQKKGVLKQDEERAEKYKQAKSIIDDYHKDFIEEALKEVKFSKDELRCLAEAYENAKSKNDKDKKALSEQQTKLRKKIVEGFKKKEKFKTLFKKELIKQDVGEWLDSKYSGAKLAERRKILEDFNTFTTYFTGFNENRKNIYSSEDHSTAIAYRIIQDNFPRYFENAKKIKTLISEFPDLDFSKVQTDFVDILNGKTVKEFFTLESFNAVLNQSGIDNYNCVRGGKTLEDGSKLKGVNEIINLYRQTKEHLLKDVSDEESVILKGEPRKLRSCKLVELYKQILSDRESLSFLPEKFEDDKELIESTNTFYEMNIANIQKEGENERKNLFDEIKNILNQLADADLEKIYVKNDKSLTDISQVLFGDFGVIKRALVYYAETQKPPKKQGNPNKKERENWDKWINKTVYFSIAKIDESLSVYKDSRIENDDADKKKMENFSSVTRYFMNQKIRIKEFVEDKEEEGIQNVLEQIQTAYKGVLPVLNDEYPEKIKNLIVDKNKVQQIKEFLDSLQNVMHFLKPLYVAPVKTEDEKGVDVFEKDAAFYTDFDFYYEKLRDIVPLYNKVRNYLTQKPYSIEKYKLNFENSTLLSGWDKNKEADNTSVLFIKDGLYYLGIMDKAHNKIFQKIKQSDDTTGYSKVVYKLLPGANKMLPKVFFSNKNIAYYAPSENLIERYKAGTHKKGENFNLSDCHTLIDFFKKSIKKHPAWKRFGFHFSPTNSYEDISMFYREVESQGYKISFENIPSPSIDLLVDEGKLYLFQIYNKDFSPYSKGKPNLHTLYWKALFDEKNLADVVFKLNGEAEIFHRHSSIKKEDRTIHKANETLRNKNEFNDKKTSTFKYDIIKDKRFTEDKFAFHVPITINFKLSNTFRFNEQVNRYLRNNPDVHILSIDRGERHLAYFTLIDQKGNIKNQRSFNIISNKYKGKKFNSDYQNKLNTAEKNRARQRKSWGSIENIKNLKEGYLSQVVHQICRMVIDHNAIVVFEDLNSGFKRGRFKVEKQIYQKLEKMLIEKLNYLVLKDKDHNEPGGVLKGYQLTAPFTTFREMGKQTGIIFYVPAYHTSKVCPVTGFVNLLYPKYESIKQARDFFKRFDTIVYDKDKGHFEFGFNYENFTNKDDGSKKGWTICTHGSRLENFRNPKKNNQWDAQEINLTDEIKALLKGKVRFEDGKDLRDSIVSQDDKHFFERFIHYLKLTLQMRNSKSGTDIDYLISPVKDSGGKGKFFDSRSAGHFMPANADANGAYHIGLKGLMVLNRINDWDEKSRLDLVIKNEQWYKFVQQKEYLKS